MSDALFLTIVFGGGLLFCGWMLGYGMGHKKGGRATLSSLYEEKLLDPTTVISHYKSKYKK